VTGAGAYALALIAAALFGFGAASKEKRLYV
jgi:hypothetical protein